MRLRGEGGFLATVIPEERNAPSGDGTLRGESSPLRVSADLEPTENESWTALNVIRVTALNAFCDLGAKRRHQCR